VKGLQKRRWRACCWKSTQKSVLQFLISYIVNSVEHVNLIKTFLYFLVLPCNLTRHWPRLLLITWCHVCYGFSWVKLRCRKTGWTPGLSDTKNKFLLTRRICRRWIGTWDKNTQQSGLKATTKKHWESPCEQRRRHRIRDTTRLRKRHQTHRRQGKDWHNIKGKTQVYGMMQSGRQWLRAGEGN